MMTFQSAVAVTPHDTNANAYEALYIGGAGNVVLVPAASGALASPITFVGVPAGSYLWVATRYVLATNTTATSIVGLHPFTAA